MSIFVIKMHILVLYVIISANLTVLFLIHVCKCGEPETCCTCRTERTEDGCDSNCPHTNIRKVKNVNPLKPRSKYEMDSIMIEWSKVVNISWDKLLRNRH